MELMVEFCLGLGLGIIVGVLGFIGLGFILEVRALMKGRW